LNRNATLATKRFTWSILLLTFGYAIAFTIVSVLINHIIEQYQLVGSEQGLMISVMNVGNTIAVFSTLMMFRGMKKSTILVISGFLSAATLAFTGISQSFAMLIVVCLFLGVSLGWTESYANSCVIDVNREDSRKYQGALHGWYGVGAVATPIAIQLLLVRNTWHEIYLLLAPIVLFTAVVYMMTARAAGKHIEAPRVGAMEFSRGEIKSFFSKRQNIYMLFAMLFYSLMQFAIFAWIVRYMSVQHDAETLGIASITLMWICTTISRFFASRLPISSMKLHALGSIITGAGLAIGLFSGNAYVMCAMVGVSGLASGHCIPTLMNEIVVTNKGGSQLPVTVMILTTRVSGITVPPVLGFIAMFSMQASMLVPIITIFISALFGFAVMRLNSNEI